MKAKIEENVQQFVYLTNDGEVILLDELVREVHTALSERGIEIDLWPLKCILRATRTVTERVSQGGVSRPGPEELCAMVATAVRAERLIIGEPLIRAVLQEYLRQLHQLDIAQVRQY